MAAADPTRAASSRPRARERILIGYGSGEETADGRFTRARQVDVRPGASRRRRREEELRPQERVAAVLGGRERLDACETLLLRARADLDAGRDREAALQLRVGLEALLVELQGRPRRSRARGGHGDAERAPTARPASAANAALRGRAERASSASRSEELLKLCERVLRRRRVLEARRSSRGLES